MTEQADPAMAIKTTHEMTTASTVRLPANTEAGRALVDKASYVPRSDWLADGAFIQPGAIFAQSWQVRNVGETTWGSGYKLLWVGDERLGAPAFVETPACPPDGQVRITVPYVAPLIPGLYKSTWQLCNASGERFGDYLWVIINVVEPITATSATTQSFPPPSDQLIPLAVVADPLAGAIAQTWNRYGGLLLAEAANLSIDPGIAVAVLVAEAKGGTFDTNGRMTIRFENHIFYEEWGKDNEAHYQQHFHFDNDQRWQNHQWRRAPHGTWQPCHGDQTSEWAVFEFACTLDETAAMRSISMATPQIMGFNHRAIGYSTVQQMFHAFQKDVRHQLRSFFRFIEASGSLAALRASDFYTFAKIYNGPGQAPLYQQIMQQNLAIYKKLARTTARPIPTATADRASGVVGLEQQPIGAWATSSFTSRLIVITDDDPSYYAAWRKQTAQRFTEAEPNAHATLARLLHPYWAWGRRGARLLGFAITALLFFSLWKQQDPSKENPCR